MKRFTVLLPTIVLIILSVSLNAQNRTELLKYKNRFLKQVSSTEHGYSLSYYEIVEQKDFPKKVQLNLHGGNEYMLIVHGLDTDTHRLKGSPNTSSGNFRSVDVEGYICSQWVDLTKASIPVSYTFTVDADKDDKSKDNASNQFLSGLGLEESDDDSELKPMIIFLVIYKSKDNKGDASGNKKENYYTQQNKPKSSTQSTNNKDYNVATQSELSNIASISPSGLKYMNGRIAIDKWMEALVKESRGEKHSVFDIMDEDWKKKHSSYRANSTTASLIDKLDGGFSHRGFTKNNLLVVDHAIDNKIVTRYYFKIKKCDDYGRIVPKQEIKDGKLHITPWQKAVVPG